MGVLIRRYWIPALLSEEIPVPDCSPVRVSLLGEHLVAFRDSRGNVGLLREACPHRGASLWFGRNEDNGLRCVFHGWKFGTDGACVDMMNEPGGSGFASKIRAVSYPTHELGGIVWAYLGSDDHIPPPPAFRFTQVPETHRHVNKTVQECNWLQGLEGGLDTSHAPILHRRLTSDTKQPGVDLSSFFAQASAPRLQVDSTDYGYRYFGIRSIDAGRTYVRAYHFVMPFTQIRPGADFGGGQKLVAGHMWVPMDDETTMVYNWEYSEGDPMADPEAVARELGTGPEELDSQYRKKRNARNDYMIDRTIQKEETFSGIFGVNTQDHAIQESMGPIANRSEEHLGPADAAIIALRQVLRETLKVVADGGRPKGAGDEYYSARATGLVLEADADWHAHVLHIIYGGQ